MINSFITLLRENLPTSTRDEINATLEGAGERGDLSYKEAYLTNEASLELNARNGKFKPRVRTFQPHIASFAKKNLQVARHCRSEKINKPRFKK